MNNDLELNSKIEQLRTEMILIGLKEGLNSPDTLKASQKLDQFLNLKQWDQ